MTKVFTFFLLMCTLPLAKLQQCRQVTVCDEDQITSRRGDKGNVGAPGKAGLVGIKGAKGEVGGVGEKGIQGESCALGAFESEIRQKLWNLETLLTPASCLTSSVYGRQALRSGEEAFCDNGWTTFQRRFDASVDFGRNWTEYKSGFGDFNGDFWLGLDKIHRLTSKRGCKLRVDVWDSAGDHKFAVYSDFSIEDESDNFRLHVKGYNGTAGDGLNEASNRDIIHNDMQFTTKDRDNDRHGANCATEREGSGWWYNICDDANLNRPVGSLEWNSKVEQLSIMKLRCD